MEMEWNGKVELLDYVNNDATMFFLTFSALFFDNVRVFSLL